MNLLWMALQAEQAAAQTPNVFNLNLGTSFWTVVIFLVLLGVLAKYAYPPILGYAEAREKRIQESLDEARHAREEAERLLEEHRQQLQQGRQQAQQLIAESKQAGERVRQQMLADARREQDALLERARADIEREREKALEALRREAVDLSLAAASKLVQHHMDAEADRRLVRDFLGRLTPDGGVEAGRRA